MKLNNTIQGKLWHGLKLKNAIKKSVKTRGVWVKKVKKPNPDNTKLLEEDDITEYYLIGEDSNGNCRIKISERAYNYYAEELAKELQNNN